MIAVLTLEPLGQLRQLHLVAEHDVSLPTLRTPLRDRRILIPIRSKSFFQLCPIFTVSVPPQNTEATDKSAAFFPHRFCDLKVRQF